MERSCTNSGIRPGPLWTPSTLVLKVYSLFSSYGHIWTGYHNYLYGYLYVAMDQYL